MSENPRIVKSLKITEVSAVRRAANPHARVLLRKSDDAAAVADARVRKASNAPRGEGPMHDKYWTLYHVHRRGNPRLPKEQSHASVWNSLSEEQQLEIFAEEDAAHERRQKEERDYVMTMTRKAMDDNDWLDWLNGVSPALRRRLRELMDVADRMERESQVTGSTPRAAVAGNSGQGELAPQELRGYGRQKRDTLEKVIADHGLVPLAKHIVDDGAHGISEDEFVALVQKYAAEKGKTAGEILATDMVLAKAAQVCRYAGYAKQAQHNIVGAQLRSRAAQFSN